MKKIDETNRKESIVLPVSSGLRDAYIAILNEMYACQQDNFWMQDIIDIISLDCGVTIDTAKDRFKQLSRFKLLKYTYSSLSGHRYTALVFSKDTEGVPVSINGWEKFNQLIEIQFAGLVEADLTRIRRSMTIREPSFEAPRIRDLRTVESELERLDTAGIIKPGEDSIKSEFKTLNKISEREVVQQLEENIRNEKDPDSTVENLNSSGKSG